VMGKYDRNSSLLHGFMSKKKYMKQGVFVDLKMNQRMLCFPILRTTEGWLMPRLRAISRVLP